MIKTLYPKNLKDLRQSIIESKHILLAGAETSTVIPFGNEEKLSAEIGETIKVSLQSLEPNIKLQGSIVSIEGAVSWKMLRETIEPFDLDVPFWPTDQDAFVLSGIATSATGERSFHYGNIRDYVESVSVMNENGEITIFHGSDSIEMLFNEDELEKLTAYNAQMRQYQSFKNAPGPLIENPVDLFIGSEGQLGVITSCELKLIPRKDTVHLLYPISEWEKSDDIVEFAMKNEGAKEYVLSCEFFDRNCIELNPDLPLRKLDHIVFEVFEESLAEFVCEIDLEEDFISIISEKKFNEIRLGIPRGINEYMSQQQLTKTGTDIQASKDYFKNLIELYRHLSTKNIPYVLFGHLGDRHLHFNYLCTKETKESADELLTDMYKSLDSTQITPFAEHGIGLLKKKFAKDFQNQTCRDFFHILKNKFDPNNKFFPQGYMSDRE